MSLNLLILGKGGNGKSSTGNSILGDRLFKPSSITANSEVGISRESSEIDNTNVTVTEVYGLDYSNMDNPEVVKATYSKIKDNLRSINKDGFCAVLI